MRSWMFLSLLACSDGPGSDKGGASDSGISHTGVPPEDLVYPSGDRVLLYYGHGGSEASGTGKAAFEDVDAHLLATTGWSTDYRSYIPDDLSTYRMIGLVGVGTNGGSAFSGEEVLQLVGALDRGTRLVLFYDREACESDVASTLLADLGVGLRTTGEAADFNSIIQTDSFNSAHQIATDVQEVRFKEPCWVDYQSGNVIAQDDQRQAIIAAERPGRGGEVVLAGDFQFFDDSGYLEFGDNAKLIENLAFVTPAD